MKIIILNIGRKKNQSFFRANVGQDNVSSKSMNYAHLATIEVQSGMELPLL
jgi:hypothetical protein